VRRFGVRLRSCPKARKGAASRLPWLEVGMGTLVFLEGGSGECDKVFFQPFILSDWGIKERHKDKLSRMDFSPQAITSLVVASPPCKSSREVFSCANSAGCPKLPVDGTIVFAPADVPRSVVFVQAYIHNARRGM
jgi:hypothetical protein